MTDLIYELRVPETGQVVHSNTRQQSLTALRELRERIGPHVEVRLVIRRLENQETKRAIEVTDQ